MIVRYIFSDHHARVLIDELNIYRRELEKRMRRLRKRARKAEAEGNRKAAERLQKEEDQVIIRIAFLASQIIKFQFGLKSAEKKELFRW